MKTTITTLEQKISELLDSYSERESQNIEKSFDSFEHLKTLADELNEAVLLFDTAGKIIYFNPVFDNLFHGIKINQNYADIIALFNENEHFNEFNKNINSFFSNNKIDKTKWNLNFTASDNSNIEFTVKLKSISNKGIPFLLLIFEKIENFVNKQGATDNKLFINEMILLEQKAENLFEYNNNLKKTKDELKEINRKKDKFFNIIAHDLRAPFNAILGLSEILNQEAKDLLPDEISDLASRIYNNSKNVLEMVEDLLDWARMQTNYMDFNPAEFNIADVISDTIYLFKQAAISKGITLKSKNDSELKVFADQNMIYMVLRNFVSNAIKFTNSGGCITISADEDSSSNIRVTVKDNGVGISSKNLEKVLSIDEHYTQLGTKKEKGTGLGLILCREFLAKNGSELHVNSDFGFGSTFSFELMKLSKSDNC